MRNSNLCSFEPANTHTNNQTHTSPYRSLTAEKWPHLRKNDNNDGDIMMFPPIFPQSLPYPPLSPPSHLPVSLPSCLPHSPPVTSTGHKAERTDDTGGRTPSTLPKTPPPICKVPFPPRGLLQWHSHRGRPGPLPPQSPILLVEFFHSTLHCLKLLLVFCFLAMYGFCPSSPAECKHQFIVSVSTA